MTEIDRNILMLAVFIALSVVLVAGLIAIPAIEQQAAQAALCKTICKDKKPKRN